MAIQRSERLRKSLCTSLSYPTFQISQRTWGSLVIRLSLEPFPFRLFIDANHFPRAIKAVRFRAYATISSRATNKLVLATRFRLIPAVNLRHEKTVRCTTTFTNPLTRNFY